MSTYLFEHGWDQERERLGLLEEVFDPGTLEHLGRLCPPVGGSALEVGAGAGSVARWLCERVGPSGRVVATDLDTGFLERLGEKNLEVRRHDIVVDELEQGAFDLIHARLVLEHIAQRDRVVERLAAALAPGGWLVLEDFDFVSVVPDPRCPEAELLVRVVDAMVAGFSANGADMSFGRRLPLNLRAAGLVEVGAEGRTQVALAGTPAARWWALGLEKLRPAAIATGLVTDAELDDVIAAHRDGSLSFIFPTMVGAWGRRPG